RRPHGAGAHRAGVNRYSLTMSEIASSPLARGGATCQSGSTRAFRTHARLRQPRPLPENCSLAYAGAARVGLALDRCLTGLRILVRARRTPAGRDGAYTLH